MVRFLWAAVAVLAGAVGYQFWTDASAEPPEKFSLTALTSAEQKALRGEMREYLLANPEVIVDAMQVLESREAEAAALADTAAIAANTDAIFNDGFSWVGGNPDGDVTIVEFVDYRCGVCRRAHPIIGDLVTFDENIRLVMKELPVLGEASVTAARFALAVKAAHGDDVYKRVHDALLTLPAGVSPRTLAIVAEREGLDPEPLMAAMNDQSITDALNANMALAQALGINGTPSFVIGDTLLRGLLPLDSLQAIVDEARAG